MVSCSSNDSDLLECDFCDERETVVKIFYHMEHPQQLNDDVDSDEEELNNENIKTTMSDSINFITKGKSVFEWDEFATKFLSKYNDYMTSVGPRKTFKTVKNMFQRISEDLENELSVIRSGLQCQNRYKTVMRRKREAINNNNSMG